MLRVDWRLPYPLPLVVEFFWRDLGLVFYSCSSGNQVNQLLAHPKFHSILQFP